MKPIRPLLEAILQQLGHVKPVGPVAQRVCPLGLCDGCGMRFAEVDGYRVGQPCLCHEGLRQRKMMARCGFPQSMWLASLEAGFDRQVCRLDIGESPSEHNRDRLISLDRHCRDLRTELYAWWRGHGPLPQGLLLDGPVSSGKTFWISAVVGDLVRAGIREVVFLSGPRILSAIAAAINEGSSEMAYVDRLIQCPLLVLDDLRPPSPRDRLRWQVKLEHILIGCIHARQPLLLTMPDYPNGPSHMLGGDLWQRIRPHIQHWTLSNR